MNLNYNIQSFFLFSPIITSWQNRFVIFRVFLSELKKLYAGSFLGIIWIVLFPLMFMGVYSMTFIMILKVRPGIFTSEQFIAVIFTGLMPFLAFSESLSRAAGAFVSNRDLIRNAAFGIEFLPITESLLAQVTGLAGIFVLLMIGPWFNIISIKCILLPIFWVFYAIFLIGLSWIVAIIGLFVKDIQRIIPSIILIFMMLSPISYTVDMLPPELRFVNLLNPLAYFIHTFRGLMLKSVHLNVTYMLSAIGISIFTFLGGSMILSGLKNSMLNNV